MSRRVMFVQYANPGAYPPIVHAAAIIAEAGMDVLVTGTADDDSRTPFDVHERVRVRLMGSPGNAWRPESHYARFATWVSARAAAFRPDWLYVSDPLACPAAIAARVFARPRVAYHEHDTPSDVVADANRGRRLATVLDARRRIGTEAACCILPNESRRLAFNRAMARTDTLTVWNCPRRDEVADAREPLRSGHLRVLYHGSIVPARLPLAVLDALATCPDASLTIVGYETLGHPGYIAALRDRAGQLGLAGRVNFVPPTMTRRDLMRHCASFDLGLSLLPIDSTDANEQAMVGASNKAFDYLAGGLALLVSDAPEWRGTFVAAGMGLATNPADPAGLTAAFTWAVSHPDEIRSMGERGRQRVLSEWHYERAFAPVLARLRSKRNAPSAHTTAARGLPPASA